MKDKKGQIADKIPTDIPPLKDNIFRSILMSWAMRILTRNLKKDSELRYAWKANIAMAFIDNYNAYQKKSGKTTMNRADRHVIANKAANYFLELLCDEIKYPEGR